jgi:hypothetical protein
MRLQDGAQSGAMPWFTRSRKQTIVVLTVATLIGVWLGATAPETSPVAPPGPAAVAPVPAPPTVQAVPFAPRGGRR